MGKIDKELKILERDLRKLKSELKQSVITYHSWDCISHEIEMIKYNIEILNKQKQQKMTKSKTSSKSKKSTKVQKVKIETTPSGTYRVRKSSNGVVVNRSFKKKKDATTFRDALYA